MIITKGQFLEGVVGAIGVSLIFVYKHITTIKSLYVFSFVISLLWLIVWILRKSVVDYYDNHHVETMGI